MVIAALLAAHLTFVQTPQALSWADLVPEGQEAETANVDHDGGAARQSGSSATVAELEGAYISLPGFLLPLDYSTDRKVSAFLLVPTYGACIHIPPPPPNQIVYVDTSDAPVETRGLWDPVVVTGTLRLDGNENGLGDTAYSLDLDGIAPYEG